MTKLEEILSKNKPKTSPPQTTESTKTENTEKQQEQQKPLPEASGMQIKTVGKAPPKTGFVLTKGRELLNLNIKPISYTIDDILCEESLIYLAGTPGSFKTGFMLHLALCGATLNPMLNHFKVHYKIKTLIIDEENGLRRTKHKFDRLVRGMGLQGTEEALDNISFQCIKGFKLTKSYVDDLEKIIEFYGFNLIVIDNVARCLIGSEQKAEDVSKIQGLLKPLIEKYHITIVIIHHIRKQDNEQYGKKRPPTLNDIRGSGDFGGQCDEMFMLDTWSSDMKSHIKTFNLYQVKSKDRQEMPPIVLKVEGD